MQVQLAARTLVDEKSADKLTPAQKRGLNYQAKVEKALEKIFPGLVILRPWFRYKVDGTHKAKMCQPDLILISPAHVCIVEVKYSTVADAWHKLSAVYKPVVEKAYRMPTSLALVTRMFDPAIGFPTTITQLEGLEHLARFRGEGLGVVSWK